MLNENVEKALVAQIEKEGYSSNLYLAMASWAESEGFSGIAQWLYAQSDEERMHMLKIIDYVNDRGGKTIIPAFDKPAEEYGDIHTMFQKVLEHEQFVTKSINEIVAVTMEEKDYTTHNWIQWFVTEQIEEESSVNAILDKLKMLGDRNLYVFDRDIMNMRGAE